MNSLYKASLWYDYERKPWTGIFDENFLVKYFQTEFKNVIKNITHDVEVCSILAMTYSCVSKHDKTCDPTEAEER